MNEQKRKRVEALGWKDGTVQEFLGLTNEESALIEVKLAVADSLKNCRTRARLSQVALAKRIGSSQSRIAKIERADPSASLDLLVRALFATGATKKDLARTILRAPAKEDSVRHVAR